MVYSRACESLKSAWAIVKYYQNRNNRNYFQEESFGLGMFRDHSNMNQCLLRVSGLCLMVKSVLKNVTSVASLST